MRELIASSEDTKDFAKAWDALVATEDAGRFVKLMMSQAIKLRASDIHLEQRDEYMLVRIRVDGVLAPLNIIRKESANRVVACIKTMAQIRIDEHRVPQDGRIQTKQNGREYDFRVNSLPVSNGREEIVMRILDKSNVPTDLSELGFQSDVEGQVKRLSAQPNGMITFTGPTGSGKTTTQYAILNMIAAPEKKILTIENPIEYRLEGLTQVQVNLKAGLTFEVALRAFLRQDPDIIMVGEMRDLETAKVAIEAALTGHLVLSTLHTNNAPSAVVRLVEMGVESYLVPDTVTGVLAQKLARRICTVCRRSYQIPADNLGVLGYKPSSDEELVTLYHGTGRDPETDEVCGNCYNGFRGRIGIFELLVMSGEIAELINHGASLSEVRKSAIGAGMRTLKQDGLDKIRQGMTTLEEVERVVFTAGAEI